MRTLVLVANDLYVRSFVSTGAFAELDPAETFFAVSSAVRRRDLVERQPNYVGPIAVSPEREARYAWTRGIPYTANRFRSRTIAIKTRQAPFAERTRNKFYALPLLRSRLVRRNLEALGLNESLEDVLDRVRPDVVVAPTSGADALILDAIRSCKRRGITTIVLMNGWDNLASKASFLVMPDHLGVWGDQSVGHATSIHGFRPEQVHAIGVPTFEAYRAFDPDRSPRPYPFRYALFCGSALPFDELSALHAIDDALERAAQEVRVVYRPHPWRQPRLCPDMFVESDFRNVVLDTQVRAAYDANAGSGKTLEPGEFLPELDYYPALVGHCEFVVSPLSTMIVEASLLDRPSLAIAYDDKVHFPPPSVVAQFDHFEGIERVDGIQLCRRFEDLPEMFLQMLAGHYPSLREQIRAWLYHDESSYAERLARLVDAVSYGASAARPVATSRE